MNTTVAPLWGVARQPRQVQAPILLSLKDKARVGSLSGDLLYSAVFGALSSKCSAPLSSGLRSCDSSSANILNVGWVDRGDVAEGTIVLTVEDSNYASMGETLGTVAYSLKTSATGKSCPNRSFEGACPNKRGYADFSVDEQLEPRMYDPREKESKDHMLVCDVVNLYTVWVFSTLEASLRR